MAKSEGCCCGATKANPCACMKKGIMKCSKNDPMCACYKEKANLKKSFDFGWSLTKGMFENPGGFGADECNICGKKGGEENPLYESKQGNSYCKGCYSQRRRVE